MAYAYDIYPDSFSVTSPTTCAATFPAHGAERSDAAAEHGLFRRIVDV
jgi:hypothetical protein